MANSQPKSLELSISAVVHKHLGVSYVLEYHDPRKRNNMMICYQQTAYFAA